MSSAHRYTEGRSGILGVVRRPLIDIEVFSSVENRWFVIENVLVDTGADVSVLPYSQGLMFVERVEAGISVSWYVNLFGDPTLQKGYVSSQYRPFENSSRKAPYDARIGRVHEIY